MNPNQIRRSIYYYEWFTHSRDEETKDLLIDKTSDKITYFLTTLYNKQSSENNYLDYIVQTQHGEEFLIIDSLKKNKICFRIVLCRETALPYVEKNGSLEELGNVISEEQNIAEVTHCVFFPEYGILGAEYNFNGARATTVSNYMKKKMKSDPMPNCRVKLNYDIYSKLIRDETFTLFDFSVRTNSEAYSKVLSNIGVFKTLHTSLPDSDTIEVVLKRRKTKKNHKTGFSLPISFDEIKELLTNYHEDIKKFNVSQGTRDESIDLLSDKFVGKVLLTKTNNRTIDSKEMYDAIEEYFICNVKSYCKKLEVG